MPEGPLHGVRVLDLSRILAGPTCTQLLGDLGADVIKVERPNAGDDTRAWGPPFVGGADEHDGESAYFLSSNRNKRSVTIDFAQPEGAALVRALAASSDVLVENYKAGTLARFGLDAASMCGDFPRLIYCSITGFGQTGPRAAQTGYDFVVQAIGGLMSLTGEPDSSPMKAGVAIADVTCGMYASVAILAALRHRDRTGEGQAIDLALFDTQIAALINAGTAYLTTGRAPARHGNAHPQIVPYQTFNTADGVLALAVGNDRQFAALCAALGCEALATDPRFATNAQRVRNRESLVERLGTTFASRETAHWVAELGARGVPCGPVQDLPAVFADPQAVHRGMRVTVPHEDAPDGAIALIGNPIKFEKTPVAYRRRPPRLGEHTDEVLRERCGLSDADLSRLRSRGVV